MNCSLFTIVVLVVTIGGCASLRGILNIGGTCGTSQVYSPTPFGPITNQSVSLNMTMYHYSASVVFGGNLYIFGGSQFANFSNATKHVQVYNPITGALTDGPDMLYARTAHSAQVYGRQIFVCGGISPEMFILGFCEMFEPFEGKWSTPSSPMVTPVHSHGSATLTDTSSTPGIPMMYIFGGSDAAGRPVDVVYSYFYGPYFDYWVTLQSMPSPRAAFGTLVQFNHVLVCGGWSHLPPRGRQDVQILDTCAYYDPVGDMWAEFPPMKQARQYPAMVSYRYQDDQFDGAYIMGGYSQFLTNDTDSVETYVKSNPSENGEMREACAGFVTLRVGDLAPCEADHRYERITIAAAGTFL